MKLYKTNYKGKHFVLEDAEDDMLDTVGEIDIEDVDDKFLIEHIERCFHYGIPPYIGKNKELQDRIDYIEEVLITKYNEQHQ